MAPSEPQPNPPIWPDSVTVFSPDQPAEEIEKTVNDAFALNGGHIPANHGEFSEHRFAFLFKPGTYPVDVPVGYYTQVMGLGASPDDVVFTGAKSVHSEQGCYDYRGGALCSFWRAAENFRTAATHNWTVGEGMLWAVSQAAPLRRVHVDNELLLYQYVPPYELAGYSSGGFSGDCRVEGAVKLGSQQQWCARSCAAGAGGPGFGPAVWNLVLAGVEGPQPPAHCGDADGGRPVVSLPKVPAVAEKPFVVCGADGRLTLRVPGTRRDTAGTSWTPKEDRGWVTVPEAEEGHRDVPFEDVFVARPGGGGGGEGEGEGGGDDDSAPINEALSAGMHVVLSPGIYRLNQPLRVSHNNQVLLGLGLATLVPQTGAPAVEVGDVDGARVCGVLLQAGPRRSDSLLQWGVSGAHPGDPCNPGYMHDVFARVGGPDPTPVGGAGAMVEVRSGWVTGDHLWLWRADHAVRLKNPAGTTDPPSPRGGGGDSPGVCRGGIEHSSSIVVVV